MDEAERALRTGQLARAHVLTRPVPEPERLIVLEPEKARAILRPDNGPATLALAWLDPRPRDLRNVIPAFAAAAALQWDPDEAASIVQRSRGDKSASYVALQAFRLWNRPYARAADPTSLAPFFHLLGRGNLHAARRALYLRLRALSLPCLPPDPLPPPDPAGDLGAAEIPDFPSRDPARAEKLLKKEECLPFLLGRWDPSWIRARWTGEQPGYAQALFLRLLPEVDPRLLDLFRPVYSLWVEALRALARFDPAAAREEAKRDERALSYVTEGETDAKIFERRFDLLRRVKGDAPACRAALYLIFDDPWLDRSRIRAVREAVGATLAAEPAFLDNLHRDLEAAGT